MHRARTRNDPGAYQEFVTGSKRGDLGPIAGFKGVGGGPGRSPQNLETRGNNNIAIMQPLIVTNSVLFRNRLYFEKSSYDGGLHPTYTLHHCTGQQTALR